MKGKYFMSISNQERGQEAYIVDQEALSELKKYNNNEQTMFETLQNIGELSLSFVEWQLLGEEAFRILDKKPFKMFQIVALDKMLDVATSYFECLVVFRMAKKGDKNAEKALKKMSKMPKTEEEKWELENLIG